VIAAAVLWQAAQRQGIQLKENGMKHEVDLHCMPLLRAECLTAGIAAV
jgi:hypothetical protein